MNTIRYMLFGFALVACNAPESTTEQMLHQHGCTQNGPDPRACDPADTMKTTVCHIPPGNPANAHTICVGVPSVPAHLAHGDYQGACGENGAGAPPPATDAGATGPSADAGPAPGAADAAPSGQPYGGLCGENLGQCCSG